METSDKLVVLSMSYTNLRLDWLLLQLFEYAESDILALFSESSMLSMLAN